MSQQRNYTQLVVLTLSMLLIILISRAALTGAEITHDALYMEVQFWVCIAFLILYLHDVAMQPRRRLRYALRHIHFLLIAIPYLNIIGALHLQVPATVMQYLHFIPLVRGAYVMVMAINIISTSRIMSIFLSYISIVALMIYFSSLLFYMREHPVNAQVTSYPTAIWWASLQFTTIGAPIDPLTPTGKILAALLAAMGVILFPLFTVYLSQTVRKMAR